MYTIKAFPFCVDDEGREGEREVKMQNRKRKHSEEKF